MNIMKFEKFGVHIGVIKSKEPVFNDEQGFLDFLAQARFEADADIFIVEKTALPEKFFDLSSGFAGMIHQKLVNYMARMAVVGDFSNYDSKALQDYIRESNDKHSEIVFLRSVNEAVSYFTD